ncbi:surface lipoprotein assembly modifier [Seleniivibrio woodruffii]|uniref:Uncharacterized protein DUF560 n=1 Tax=Seleniivibrio woodruffii TaxID=1078050 RepID=A0A4R1KAM8_9BACT|nr:surface lipoprotein assembly modifier [Seleniivibrio woodruffii]TCK61516.1 uncharacterized protein DUF560 [Seleniivibrio woodruffii]TVZ35368.1 uncharacterized protein DUF560 [Seleniivibrio woodruffii]
MRRFVFTAGLMMAAAFCPAVVNAYDYPVIGDYNSAYQKVFDAIKAGKCRSMESELKALSASEGISGSIYRSICFFENNQPKEGFLGLTLMLENQEYDEIVYVTNTQINKGNTDPVLLKFRGLAYFNIGDMNGALADITAYTDKTGDVSMRLTLVDIYMSMNDLDRAEAELEKAPKEDGYYSRKGKLLYRKGDFSGALANFRMVSPADAERYTQAQSLIADICLISGRFQCVYEAVANFKGETAAGDAKEKLEKVRSYQRPFSIYAGLTEEYDDNVRSENEDIGSSGVSSFRTAMVLDAKYNLYPLWADKFSAGLMNYRSFNMKKGLSSFDLEMHKAYVQFTRSTDTASFTPKLTAGILSLGNSKYYESFGAELASNLKLGEYGLNVPVKFEKRSYVASPDPRADKDGYVYGISGELSRTLADKYIVSLGLGVDVENTDGEDKDNTAYTLSVGTLAALTKSFTLSVSADYTYSDFYNSAIDDRNRPGLAIIREDKAWNLGLKGIYRLTNSMFVSGGVTYSDVNSNVDEYTYDKTVFDIGISYTY